MIEEWRDIKGWEGFYQASNLGRIKNLERKTKIRFGYKVWPEKIRKFQDHRKGYKLIILCKNGYRKTKYVHRVIAETFIDNPCNKREINHIDGNKHNNKISNLEWVSREENMSHWKNFINRPKGYNIEKRKKNNIYNCYITIDNKSYLVGTFNNKEECKIAYIETNKEFFGIAPILAEN